jgi:hypothetical protein
MPKDDNTDTPEQPEEKEQPDKGKEKKEHRNSEEGHVLSEQEYKEFREMMDEQKEQEKKEFVENIVDEAAKKTMQELEKKEKVLNTPEGEGDDVSREFKEFRDGVQPDSGVEIKEQFKRAGRAAHKLGLSYKEATTSRVEERDYPNFTTRGTKLEYKGLSLGTNQANDYFQSDAELQDIYDPVIYNALNQDTITWNLLMKDDESGRGNNHMQFKLKTGINETVQYYKGNQVNTGDGERQKYQTRFKKASVGVSVDGDMIAAARGGPVDEVFALEVEEASEDLREFINESLFGTTGAESDAAIIGMEYIADSSTHTELYGKTRTAANKLAPDSAGDTYIDGGSDVIGLDELRAAKRQAIEEGARKENLVFITSLVQGDKYRGKFDDSRVRDSPTDTRMGFETDMFIDGIPIFEDTDCPDESWFLVDTESHRVGMWVPPTIERLGKTADAEDAFIKTYFAVYNRRPRALVQIHSNAT